MELENYLRAFMPGPQEPQDHFGEGVEMNSAEAIFETHGGESSPDVFDLEEEKLPSDISLLVTLAPQKILEVMPDYRLEFSSKGASDGMIFLNQIPGELVQHCCASIDIRWCGKGSQRGDIGAVEDLCTEVQGLPTGLLYRKTFNTPPGDSFSCQEILTEAEKWVYGCSSWEVPRENERPLIPFGGYFSEALDLEKMMPMYGYIGGGDITELGLKAQTFWQRSGVYPGHRGLKDGRFYSLIDLHEPYVQTTLAQDIRRGNIRLGGDDFCYVSHGYDVVDPVDRTLLLHFKQG